MLARMTCPRLRRDVEPDALHTDTITASRYRCPGCGTTWHRDYSGLLAERDG